MLAQTFNVFFFPVFSGISMHKGYAFVQFTNPFDARSACLGEDGRTVLSQILGKSTSVSPALSLLLSVDKARVSSVSCAERKFQWFRGKYDRTRRSNSNSACTLMLIAIEQPSPRATQLLASLFQLAPISVIIWLRVAPGSLQKFP